MFVPSSSAPSAWCGSSRCRAVGRPAVLRPAARPGAAGSCSSQPSGPRSGGSRRPAGADRPRAPRPARAGRTRRRSPAAADARLGLGRRRRMSAAGLDPPAVAARASSQGTHGRQARHRLGVRRARARPPGRCAAPACELDGLLQRASCCRGRRPAPRPSAMAAIGGTSGGSRLRCQAVGLRDGLPAPRRRMRPPAQPRSNDERQLVGIGRLGGGVGPSAGRAPVAHRRRPGCGSARPTAVRRRVAAAPAGRAGRISRPAHLLCRRPGRSRRRPPAPWPC